MPVLKKDVYDVLNLSAERYNGIGGRWFFSPHMNIPQCIFGHAIECGVNSDLDRVWNAGRNDTVVACINRRKGVNLNNRVSWKEYCVEANFIRGED